MTGELPAVIFHPDLKHFPGAAGSAMLGSGVKFALICCRHAFSCSALNAVVNWRSWKESNNSSLTAINTQ